MIITSEATDSPSIATDDLPPLVVENEQADTDRFVLASLEELRLEFHTASGGGVSGGGGGSSGSGGPQSHCLVTLLKGSCEIVGVELALQKPYRLDLTATSTNALRSLAIFSFHGCVLDIVYHPDKDSLLSYAYVCTSDDTTSNIAYVNTHAQLEVLRDDAVLAQRHQQQQKHENTTMSDEDLTTMGPRVLIVGGRETGKTTLTKTLLAYACKLGRTPLWVDLDMTHNAISVDGTIACVPMIQSTGGNPNNNTNNMTKDDSISVESFAAVNSGCCIPPTSSVSPVSLWHGTANPSKVNVDLLCEQISALGEKLSHRLTVTTTSSTTEEETGGGAAWERSSGIIVDTPSCFVETYDSTGSITSDEGHTLLLHTVEALKISVILVVGHDKLYSLLRSHFASPDENNSSSIKVIKLPKSDGIVARDINYMRRLRSCTMKRYFYGGMVDAPNVSGGTIAATGGSTTHRVPQLTPFLLQLPFAQVRLYKFTSIHLAASLLPVAAQQTTEAVQLVEVSLTANNNDGNNKKSATSVLQQHMLLAVCHPHAVDKYLESGNAKDLYTAGVAGFVAVERILPETEMLHLLSPCAGSLPSNTLLVGDVTWME